MRIGVSCPPDKRRSFAFASKKISCCLTLFLPAARYACLESVTIFLTKSLFFLVSLAMVAAMPSILSLLCVLTFFMSSIVVVLKMPFNLLSLPGFFITKTSCSVAFSPFFFTRYLVSFANSTPYFVFSSLGVIPSFSAKLLYRSLFVIIPSTFASRIPLP